MWKHWAGFVLRSIFCQSVALAIQVLWWQQSSFLFKLRANEEEHEGTCGLPSILFIVNYNEAPVYDLLLLYLVKSQTDAPNNPNAPPALHAIDHTHCNEATHRKLISTHKDALEPHKGSCVLFTADVIRPANVTREGHYRVSEYQAVIGGNFIVRAVTKKCSLGFCRYNFPHFLLSKTSFSVWCHPDRRKRFLLCHSFLFRHYSQLWPMWSDGVA